MIGNLIKVGRRKASKIYQRRVAMAYLGCPAFRDRIQDRHRRWEKFGRPEGLEPTLGKTLSKQFVEGKGYAVPDVHTWLEKIEDLPDFKDLPSSFVLKPVYGHSSMNVFPIQEGRNPFDGAPMTRETVIDQVKGTTDSPFIIEEFLQNFDGKQGIPNDYKFYCFGSKIAFIQVIERNSFKDPSQNRHWFVTEDWTRLGMEVRIREFAQPGLPARPPFLPDMVSMAKDLVGSMGVFLRLDLYASTRGPVFGEFTAFPFLGGGYTPEANAWLGRMWKGKEGC